MEGRGVLCLYNVLPVAVLHIDGGDMRVNHRRIHLFMAEELADIHQRHTALHGHSSRGMPEHVGRDVLVDVFGGSRGDLTHGFLDSCGGKSSVGLAFRNKQELAVICAGGQVCPDCYLRLGIDERGAVFLAFTEQMHGSGVPIDVGLLQDGQLRHTAAGGIETFNDEPFIILCSSIWRSVLFFVPLL